MMADETLWDYANSPIGGSLCNFDKRWNPQKLEETFLLLLLGKNFDKRWNPQNWAMAHESDAGRTKPWNPCVFYY
jgi:hypothetical protein